LALTDKSALGEGDEANLDVHVSVDKEKRMISIRDKGIGMTKSHLIDHLGTIAKSGTAAFLDTMASGGDMSMIGQFGVGFYSVYLVADHVEVVTKNNDDSSQWIWESKADGAFVVTEDKENEPLGRGTDIRIYLKEEMLEYLEESKLRQLITTYSEFIQFPIYLEVEKTEYVEVEIPADEAEDDEAEEGEDSAPKTKKVKEVTQEWEQINSNKAIWLRTPKDVEEEEYNTFYKTLTKDFKDPLAHTHFSAEGDVEFKAILYVPEEAPPQLFNDAGTEGAERGLKLYVRRVFISDEFDELLPKYLSFVKGLVDSDSLPLNVSREQLQQSSSLKTIKKKLVRKVLDMLRKMADDEMYEDDEGEEASTDEVEMKYTKFWEQYGKAIKLGIIDDSMNRSRLAKLLRFRTSEMGSDITSLEEYVDRMKEGQDNIYYLACSSIDECATSSSTERLIKEGYEVIYFTDPIDEYVMQQLTEFEDKSFQNASKENLKVGEQDAALASKIKDLYKPLTKWWKDISDDIDTVKISQRLTSSPMTVVTSKYGWSANMERIMSAQALGSDTQASYMKSKKTLEINAKHPVIIAMLDKVNSDSADPVLRRQATILYENALLESGFALADPKAFSERLLATMQDGLGVSSMEVDDGYEFPFPETPEIDAADEEDATDLNGEDNVNAHDDL